jgi:hypothetical protein
MKNVLYQKLLLSCMAKIKAEGTEAAEALCYIMSKNYWLHEIERDLKKIFEKLGIFTGKPVMEFKINRRFEPKCYISCVIKAENNIFGKDLTIVIKPDLGSKHKVLREIVQEDSNMDMKAEDKDVPGTMTIVVFTKELKALESDIEEALKKFKKREAA